MPKKKKKKKKNYAFCIKNMLNKVEPSFLHIPSYNESMRFMWQMSNGTFLLVGMYSNKIILKD